MSDQLAVANLRRDELALWIMEGVFGKRVPAHLSPDEAIADLKAAGQFEQWQLAADHVLAKLAAAFKPGVPS